MKANSPGSGKSGRSSALYSSKIIKAGALISDTKTLFAHWDPSASVAENIRQIRQHNVFSKASRARIDDIVAIFRQRYLAEECVTKALVSLVRGRFPAPALGQVFYFHSARADKLLYDAVTEVLVPMSKRGLVDVAVGEIQRHLARWVAEGKTTAPWSAETLTRVAQGLLSSLRDFGVLQGAQRKRIAPQFLAIEAFSYIAFYLKRHQPSGAKLLELTDWKLFFLTREDVERYLIEAHQRQLLEYYAAGSVTRLTFPASTLEEYANALVQG